VALYEPAAGSPGKGFLVTAGRSNAPNGPAGTYPGLPNQQGGEASRRLHPGPLTAVAPAGHRCWTVARSARQRNRPGICAAGIAGGAERPGITGNFSAEECPQTLEVQHCGEARASHAGPRIIEVRTVGPTLGAENVRRSARSAGPLPPSLSHGGSAASCWWSPAASVWR